MFIKHAAVAALVTLCLPVLVQAADMKHDHKAMQNQMSGDDSASSKAYAAASAKMHRDMTVSLSGNADVDFVRGMIPHHQGAIDMAKVELEYGKDPEIRKMAQGIIAAQEAEIAEMKRWLEKHGK